MFSTYLHLPSKLWYRQHENNTRKIWYSMLPGLWLGWCPDIVSGQQWRSYQHHLSHLITRHWSSSAATSSALLLSHQLSTSAFISTNWHFSAGRHKIQTRNYCWIQFSFQLFRLIKANAAKLLNLKISQLEEENMFVNE